MANHYRAAVLTMSQMFLIEKALDNLPVGHALDRETADAAAIRDQLAILTEKKAAADHAHFDVLGWHPGISQWVHLFAWRKYSLTSAHVVAENDNSRFEGPYTHFCIIPVPMEKIA